MFGPLPAVVCPESGPPRGGAFIPDDGRGCPGSEVFAGASSAGAELGANGCGVGGIMGSGDKLTGGETDGAATVLGRSGAEVGWIGDVSGALEAFGAGERRWAGLDGAEAGATSEAGAVSEAVGLFARLLI